MRSFVSVRPALALAAAFACPALAQHGDVGFRVENNAITTWLADDLSGQFLNPERVFEGELLDLGGIITGDEPGFFGEPGTLAGARLGFNIRKALRVWDVPFQNLAAIAPTTITITAPLVGSVTTPLLDPPSPIAGLSVVVTPGGFDFHYDNVLNSTTPGIYLLELELWTDAPGVANSLPFWYVLNFDMPEPEHEAAVDWVRDNLAPTPATASFALLGLIFATRRARCKRF
ncbi:MAG: hypothetical protein ACKVW3_16450 [Phycisphaerales bacterium]